MKNLFSQLSVIIVFIAVFPILTGALAIDTSTLTFTLSTNNRIPKEIFGVNQNWYRDYSINDSIIADGLKQINIQQVRFPGGGVGNYYNWQTLAPNWEYVYSHDTNPYIRSKPNYDLYIQSLSAIDFANSVKNINAKTTMVLDVYTNTQAQLVEGLQKLKNAGIRVTRLEMGNELFLGSHYNISSIVYIDRSKQIATVAKQLFPEVKIGVAVGLGGISWDIPNGAWFDAVIFHPYERFSGELSNSNSTFISWITHGNKNRLTTLTNTARAKYPDKEFWFTEWDLSEQNEEQTLDTTNSYTHAYFVYDFLLNLLRFPKVTTANFHELVLNSERHSIYKPRSTYFSMYFGSPGSDIPNNTYTSDQFFFKLAPYWPMYWIGRAFNTYDRFAIATYSGKEILGVYFYQSTDPGNGNFALINKSNSTVKISTVGIQSPKPSYTISILNKPWTTKSTETAEFMPTTTTMDRSNLTLPPYAIAYASFSDTIIPDPSDLNQDGITNTADVDIFIPNYGSSGTNRWIRSDINNNGVVDIYDYNLIVENFGR